LQILVKRPDLNSSAPGVLPYLQVQLLPYLIGMGRFEEATILAIEARGSLQRPFGRDVELTDYERSALDRTEFHLGESLLRQGRAAQGVEVLEALTARLKLAAPPGSPGAPMLLPMAWKNLASGLENLGRKEQTMRVVAAAIGAALPHLEAHPAARSEVLRWIDELLVGAVTWRGGWENDPWPTSLLNVASRALSSEQEALATVRLVEALARFRRAGSASTDSVQVLEALRIFQNAPGQPLRAAGARRWHAAEAAREVGEQEFAYKLQSSAMAALRLAPDQDPLELANWQSAMGLTVVDAWTKRDGLLAVWIASTGAQYARDAAATLDALANQQPPLPTDRFDALFTAEAQASIGLCLNLAPDEGIEVLNRAWARHGDSRVPGLRVTLSSFAMAFCQLVLIKPDAAAFWFKLAEEQAYQLLMALPPEIEHRDQVVNATQRLRTLAREGTLQLMIRQGRVAEAQILRQLGAEINFEIMTRSAASPRTPTAVPFNRAEAQAREALLRATITQAAASARQQALELRARLHPLTEHEQRELAELKQSNTKARQGALAAAQRQLTQLLTSNKVENAGDGLSEAAMGRNLRLNRAMERLASESGGRVAGLQVLRSRDQVLLLLNRPSQAPKVVTVTVPASQLDAALDEALTLLQTPESKPRFYGPVLQRLHQWLFAPVEKELTESGTQTVLLSLEGSLQLLPFAALMDAQGEHLIKRYRFAYFNEEAAEQSNERRLSARTVAAFGASDFGTSHPQLRHVPAELQAVIQTSGKGSRLSLGKEFNRANLTEALRRPSGPGFNVLHLATHFVLVPQRVADSHLVLGDGQRFTLIDFLQPGADLSAYDLVVFSACDSARLTGAEGLQARSLSSVAQRLGASAVIGTLWRVDDEGSAVLMREIYRPEGTVRDLPLRRLWDAQEAMAAGRLEGRAGKPLAHPFFWAAFVGTAR
jgi:CHAT domain-containing protein